MSWTERKSQILRALVNDYIATGEPVGSKRLVEHYPLQLSSASVRHVLAELEAEGYLIQPHASAGRRPSDQAYRYYVDHLLRPSQPDRAWEEAVSQALSQIKQPETLIHKASEILAKTTGYPAITWTAHGRQTLLKQLKFLPLEPGRLLVLLVLQPTIVKDRVVEVSEPLDSASLEQLSTWVEQELVGRPLEEINWVTLQLASTGLTLPETFLQQILLEAYGSILEARQEQTHLEGVSQLLSYPEFQDPERIQPLLSLLLDKGQVTGYLNAPTGHSPSRFWIRIGQELVLPELKDCSFVTTTYEMGGQLSGQIGIFGPKRMPYDQLIHRIGFVRQTLQRCWHNQGGNQDEIYRIPETIPST